MSKMVEDAIAELEEHKDSITALIMVADGEDFMITKTGAHGASTADMMALVGVLEMMQQDLLQTIRDAGGYSSEKDDPILQ